MAVSVREKPKQKELGKITGPSFRDPATMTPEELTDPDYGMKLLLENFGGNKEGQPAICSRCHHCRR